MSSSSLSENAAEDENNKARGATANVQGPGRYCLPKKAGVLEAAGSHHETAPESQSERFELSEPATLRIPVGVVVERHRAQNPWLDAVYRPVSVLSGVPATAPWTTIDSNADVTTLYAGEAVVELFRTETAQYQQNLVSGKPSLWVVLRPVATGIRFALLLVTADPAEGEALTGAGNDLVEPVPMPPPIIRTVAAFVAQHPPTRSFYKRERDRSVPAHRDPGAASLKGRGSRS